MNLLLPHDYEKGLRQQCVALGNCSVDIDDDSARSNLIHISGYYGNNPPRKNPLFCYPYASSLNSESSAPVTEVVDHLPVHFRTCDAERVRMRMWILTTMNHNPKSASIIRDFFNAKNDISREWHDSSLPEQFQWIKSPELFLQYVSSYRLFSLRQAFAAALFECLDARCGNTTFE